MAGEGLKLAVCCIQENCQRRAIYDTIGNGGKTRMARQLDSREFRERTTPFGDQIGDDWGVKYTVDRDVRGDLVIVSLEIRRRHTSQTGVQRLAPAGGLSRDVLRRFQVGAALRYARQVIKTQALSPAAPVRRAGPGRPPTVTVPEYKRLHDRYLELVEQRHPAPLKHLAAENPGISRSAMAQRMSRWKKNAAVSQPLAESQPETKKPRKKRGS
jgi:hypothetical protein